MMTAGAQLRVPADLEHDEVPVRGALHRDRGHRRQRAAAVSEPAGARQLVPVLWDPRRPWPAHCGPQYQWPGVLI